MYPNLSGKTVDLNCLEQVLPDFPNLLFGDSPEIGTFFDATEYITKTQPNLNVIDFFKEYEAPIKSLCSVHGIKDTNEVFVMNTQGHILIEPLFTCLFISFVEPNFLAYMCERMDDLFSYGFCVSDTVVYNLAKYRLPNESLKKIINEPT